MKNKTIKNFLLNTWYDYEYQLGNKILLAQHIEFAVKNFWLELVEHLQDNQFIRIHFKLKTTEGQYRSVSYIQTVNKSDLDKLIEIFKEYWNIRGDDYHTSSVDSIVFTYKIELKEGSYGESKLIQHKKVLLNNTKPFKFGGFKLPTTMDITKWSGNVQFNEDFTSAIVYINKSQLEYHVSLFDNYQTVKAVINNNVLLEFTDTVTNGYDLSSFTRKLKAQLYIFENGELVVKQIERKVNFLTKISTDDVVSDKFITMDLETRTLNGILEPFCVSTYFVDSDGIERVRSFYLGDYKTPDEMLKDSIESLFEPKFDGYKVYLHNFSNFDAIFLIRILSELSSKIKPIIRDGRIIDLSVSFGYNQKYTIRFRDSYLLLEASLNSLAKDFNVDCQKGIFPYNFVNNPNVKLNYFDLTPDISFFEGISKEQYDEYRSKRGMWDLAFETKYYCELDCKVLYLVIKTFANQIFDLFKIDITKYPTLPSLGLAIYRSTFLKDDFKIPLIDGSVYSDLKKGYTGGMVDVYQPTNDPSTKAHSYDVNSLYPYSMKYFAMPVGTPKFFEGNILRINPEAFGVFEVEVKAPDNLKYPVLQTKVQINGNNTTIAPLGNWTGWYFSAEIFNAMKYGYVFKVLRGYLFEKNYVESFFKIHQNTYSFKIFLSNFL